MDGWYRVVLITCASLSLLTGGVQSIQVVEEPRLHVAENGTLDEIILDCPFSLEEDDTEGLIINWYLDNNPIAVYQWIVGKNNRPQGMGILAGRLDLEYTASEDAHHRHRALRILNPSTELSGQYTCKISSFSDEKTYKQKLIIYSEPQGVRVWTEQRNDNEVTVLCEVDKVYPQPSLHLCQRTPVDNCEELSGIREVNSWSRGSYNVTVERNVEEDSLDGPTVFECAVTIPDTEVEVTHSTKYQPMRNEGSDSLLAASYLVGIALLAIWQV